MEIFTIGFTQSSAEHFFRRLKSHGIQRLLDVRLNNRSQLAGFAKRDDLAFFLRELLDADYRHMPLLAPTQEILDAYKKSEEISWQQYEDRFLRLLSERCIEDELSPGEFRQRTVLLCSEPTPERCHRRLIVEYLVRCWPDVKAVHL